MECSLASKDAMFVVKKATTSRVEFNTYMVRLYIPKFTFKPGQYIKVTSRDGITRFFSVFSFKEKCFFNEHVELSILVRFNEYNSQSHQLIKRIESGEELYISESCGNAYWRETNFGNVLISCDTGYSYIRNIIEHISIKKNSAPTLVIIVKDDDHFFDKSFIDDKLTENKVFTICMIKKEYSLRDKSFISELITFDKQETYKLF